MKKIYLALLALSLGVSAQAQRSLSVACAVVKPAIDTNITTTSTQSPRYLFQNVSATTADSIQVGDTVVFFTPTSTFSGGSYTSYSYFISPITIKKDSIVAVNGGSVPYASIEGLYNLTFDTLKAKPFTSNKQYLWYIRTGGVLPGTGNMAVSSFTSGRDSNRVWINKSTTGIAEVTISNGLKTYPNPAVSTLHFDYDFAANKSANVRILDIDGRTLYSRSYENLNGQEQLEVDVKNLATGSYILYLNIDNKIVTNAFNVVR